MFRLPTPKTQATLLGAYFSEKGVSVKRTELLELVSKLNGAKSWQELQAVTGKERHTENSCAIRDLLLPLADKHNAVEIVEQLKPFGNCSGQESYYRGLFDILRGASADVSAGASLRMSKTVLQDLKKDVDFLIEVISRKMGSGKIVENIPSDWVTVGFETYFSEDYPFVLSYNGNLYEIDDNFMSEIITESVARICTVTYPRGDIYGVPFEATQDGGTEWALENGFKILKDFVVLGVDGRDDSIMSFNLTASVNPDLYAKIEQYIAENYS